MGCAGSNHAAEEKRPFHREYKLGKKLGEGAFGQVRIAQHRMEDSEYAVKIIDCRCRGLDGEPTREPDRERVSSSKMEVKVWEAVGSNDHCVQILNMFFEKNLFYMVMERCQCSLMDKLSKMSSMMEFDLCRIFREMLKGIHHVHEVKIAHRDIKPDNFLFGGSSGETVKLCDFGLASQLPKSGLLKGVYGTAPYMSPEMLEGKGYDLRTDVWSYGATCFLMVHGDFPYSPRESTAPAMKKAILMGKPAIMFVRPPDEDQFFSSSFVDSATPFLQCLLQRSAATRRSAEDALQEPFLMKDEPKKQKQAFIVKPTGECDAPLAPAIRLARKATREFRGPIDGIRQRTLEELLEKLQERTSSGTSSSMCFSETLENTDDPSHSQRVKPAPSDSRIRQRSETRHSTHSGVLSPKVADAGPAEAPM